jgi:PAS domain S-box-containing protein
MADNSANTPELLDIPADPARLAQRCRILMAAERPAVLLPLLYYLDFLEGSQGRKRARTAQMLGWCHLRLGHLDEAEATLAEAVQRAGSREPGVALEAGLLQAEVLGARQRYDAARARLRELSAQLGDEPAPAPGLEAQAALLEGELGRQQGDLETAAARLERAEAAARAAAEPGLRGRVALAQGRLAWARGQTERAAESLATALRQLEDAGVEQGLGEAYLQSGAFVGDADAGAPGTGPLPLAAAQYLARAQQVFARSGSLRDLDRVRQHFRLYGRRATDRVADEAVAKRAEQVYAQQRALGQHLEALLPELGRDPAGPDEGQKEGDEAASFRAASEALWRRLASVHTELHRGLVTLSRGMDRLVDAGHAVVVERDQLRRVLDGVRGLHLEGEPEQLTREVVGLAARVVDADRVVLALVSRSGELTAREQLGMDTAPQTEWRLWADQARRTRAPVLADPEPDRAGPDHEGSAGAATRPELGRCLAVPILQGDRVHGVIYVDRQRRGGVFTRREMGLLELVAQQTGSLLERQRMNWALQMAARVRDATMEAISDGVMAVSVGGEVRSVNSAACQLLGRSKAEVEGRPVTQLGVLARHLSEPARLEALEGKVLRLPKGEALVSARTVRDDQGAPAGTVLTFTGMKRAQRTAQRIVGAQARYRFEDIIGTSPAFLEQLELGRAAARADTGVLITGESGTGKEVMAQAIHNASPRAEGPFVGINCAAIPRDLLESELFGYEGGAFTGAKRGGQPGKFELAEGGTILLDEIGDMPLGMQAKLLRVLQERRFQRVGGHREHVLDARIIATTNQDIEEAATEHRFRHDLLFRLQVIHLLLPPLRQRPEDIPVFLEHFLRRSAERLGKGLCRVAPHVMESFADYAWPGNIRELEYIVESEVNLADEATEELERIPAALRPARRRRRETLVGLQTAEEPPPGRAPSGSYNLQDVEQEIFVAALREHRGNVPAVAKSLGVSRGTVYNKLRKYELDIQDFRTRE